MIIESLDIRHFGKLSDFKATFDDGFNLIEGSAESGKTTLAAFIVYMLYGFPEEKTAFSERLHRTPWEGVACAGSMTFTSGGARYRIERSSESTERGWRDTYALQNLTTGLAEQGAVSPGERFLGVTLESFTDTALLSDVRRGGVGKEKTADAIENILFSGDEKLSSERALRQLREVAKELYAGEGGSGAASVLERERDNLKEELAEATAKERLHYEREEELFLTRKRIEEAEREVEKFSKLETNYYNALMIEDYDRLHTLEDASGGRVSAIRAHEDAYRAEGFLPDRAYIASILEAKSETLSTGREAEDAEATHALLPEGADAVDADTRALLSAVDGASGEATLRRDAARALKKERTMLTLAILCGVLSFASFIMLGVMISKVAFAALFGVLGIVTLGGLVLFLVEGLRARRSLFALYAVCGTEKKDDFQASLQAAAEARIVISQAAAEKERSAHRLSRAKERYALASKRLSEILARWGVVLDMECIETQVSDTALRAEEYLTEHERLSAEHRAAENEVLALRQKLEGQNEIAVRARVAPDDRKRYRNQNAKDLRRGVELYTDRLKALRTTERGLLDDLAAEERGESLAAIAERILALDGRIARIKEQAAAITAAYEAVEGGAERLRAEISPRLSLDACRFLYEMTDGKYSDITVSDDFSVSYDEGDGERTVAFLSHSTEDLAYYALRLSLLNLMYKEMPPVCFDGCTARQDDERALSFLRAVRTLTEEGKQCFFFTSAKREGALAKRVFSSYRHIKMPE